MLYFVCRHWSKHLTDGPALEASWEESLAAYEQKYPEEAAEFKQLISQKLPTGWEKALPVSIFRYILVP